MSYNFAWPLKPYRHIIVDQEGKIFGSVAFGLTESVDDQYKRAAWVAEACNAMKKDEDDALQNL